MKVKPAGDFMKFKKIVLLIPFGLFLFAKVSFGASFNCSKASTAQEKLVCNTPQLNEADGQMGEIYKLVNKSFPISGFVQDNQRTWLFSYKNCKDATNCLQLLNSRIKELNILKTAAVYADYDGNKLVTDSGTIVITEEGSVKTAKFFGNWMTDGYMDPNKIRGYPKDGYICNEDMPLAKKGNVYVSKEGAASDDFSLLIDASKIVMKGFVMCSARCSFGPGTYKRK